jgi:hypothetical protein
MTETELLVIERACERLVLDSVAFNDALDFESFAGLFSAEGVMIRPAGDELVGPAAILAAYRSKPAGRTTRHIVTNVRITVEASDRARGLSYAVVYGANACGPTEGAFGVRADPRQLVGEFEDEFILTAEGWRFRSRRARFVMHT